MEGLLRKINLIVSWLLNTEWAMIIYELELYELELCMDNNKRNVGKWTSSLKEKHA